MKPEISHTLDSLLAEIETTTCTKVLRATASDFRRTPTCPLSQPPQQTTFSPQQTSKVMPFVQTSLPTVSLDLDLLSNEERHLFQQSLIDFDLVFDPNITGYNEAARPIEATVNIGSVQPPPPPPQRKESVPQYFRNLLAELQAHFDELEQAQLFPEDLNLTVEYLNSSFLVRKPSGGHRLVTAFADVARYRKPQPSLSQMLLQPSEPSLHGNTLSRHIFPEHFTRSPFPGLQ